MSGPVRLVVCVNHRLGSFYLAPIVRIELAGIVAGLKRFVVRHAD